MENVMFYRKLCYKTLDTLEHSTKKRDILNIYNIFYQESSLLIKHNEKKRVIFCSQLNINFPL
jgi:hypothetical protein